MNKHILISLTTSFFILLFVWYHTSNISDQRIFLEAKVVEIIDGDTFKVYVKNTSKYEKIRLKCIDYPDLAPDKRKEKWTEYYEVNESILEKCYYEGINILEMLLENQTIYIKQDKYLERDKYSRLLGYVIYNNTDINEWLIKEGFAIPYICDKYKKEFNKKGCLWN